MEKPKGSQDEWSDGRRKFLKGLGVATVTVAGIAVKKEGGGGP